VSNGVHAVDHGLWLNIGSGPSNPDGWISIDGSWQARAAAHPLMSRVLSAATGREVGAWPRGIVHRDVRRGLGFPDASALVVYSSHLLEHLHRDEALALLRDARRVLKSGGVCRMVVPDVRAIVRWYVDHVSSGATDVASSDLLMDMMMVRPRARDGRGGWLLSAYRRYTEFDAHKWMYDATGLRQLFRDAGFEAPTERCYLESAIARERLALVESADRLQDGAGVCVEALA